MIDVEQARFFARNGYVQLPGLIPAPTCRHLVESTCRLFPAGWRRDNPTTWRGEVTDSCHTADLEQRAGLLKFQQKELLADPLVVAGYQQPSVAHAAAVALIGRPLQPIHLRGLYAIVPIADSARFHEAPSPHVEAHAAQIVALTYLDDVAPGGGGIMVWPGSHRDLYGAFRSKFEFVAGRDLHAAIAEHLRWRPREIHGGVGDLILMHHRLLHSPSVNRSNRIRFGFLCDYTPCDHRARSKELPGDLWEDWPGLVAMAGSAGLDGAADRTGELALPKPRRLLVRGNGTASSRNKSDASAIARLRQPGDVWLSIADTPELHENNHRLDPIGGRVAARRLWPWSGGLGVTLAGRRVASVSQGAFTARLRVQAGQNRIVLRGIRRPLWLRVIAIEVPFRASRVLARGYFDGSTRTAELTFEASTAAAAATGP
jgi:hypothetical protein